MNETEKRPEAAPEPELTTQTPGRQEEIKSGLVPSCLGGESSPPAAPRLADELGRMAAEPLLPIEKKLIAWSLILGVTLLLLLLWLSRYFAPVAPGAPPRATPATAPAATPSADSFRFTLVADQRNLSDGFRKVCRAIQEQLGGPGAFLVSPGDEDPPDVNRRVIEEELGAATVWYPVVGNHEAKAKTPAHMAWLRAAYAGLPAPLAPGPPGCETTTYAFDRGDAHFVVLNEYYDGKTDTGADGTICPELYDWLAADLERNKRPWVFVIGHEPAFPQPDARWGDARHTKDSLNAHVAERDRFWALLEARGVTAYLCGHTHRYSRYQHAGGRVWQVDTSQARGERYDAIVSVAVAPAEVRFEVWRDYDEDGKYQVEDRWSVAAGAAAATAKPAAPTPPQASPTPRSSPVPATPRLSLEEAHQALRVLDPWLRDQPVMTSVPDVAYISGWICNLAERQFERTSYSIDTHTITRGVFDPPAGGQGWRARLVEQQTERNPPGADVGEYRPDYPPGRSPARPK